MIVRPTKLRDLCTLITKGTTPTSVGFNFSDEGIPFLRVQNIWGGTVNYSSETLFIDGSVHAALKRSQIVPGDVLISIAGTIGRTAVVPEHAPELNCNQAVAILRTKPGVYRPYLRHWLESPVAQGQIRGATVTGTIQNLSLGQIGDMTIVLPPISEQHRIAAILDKADALRVKRREALEHLNNLAQSIFLEMFGDPVTNPKGWQESTVGDISSIQGGLQLSSKRSNLPLTVPYLRVANVYRDRLVLDEIKLFRATAAELEKTRLVKNDVLIVEGHGNPEEIGRCAIWDGSIEGCSHQNHLIRLRVHRELAVPTYVARFLNSAGGRKGLLNASNTTSGLNTISVSKVRSCRFLLPPVELQEAYAVRLWKIERMMQVQSQSLIKLDHLFFSLQHRLLGGEAGAERPENYASVNTISNKSEPEEIEAL